MFTVETLYITDKQMEEIKISHYPNSEISYPLRGVYEADSTCF